MGNNYWEFLALTVILVFFSKTHQWSMGCIPVVIVLIVSGYYKIDLDEPYFPFIGVACIFSFAYLFFQDMKHRKKDSVFLKYNPLNKNNALPAKLRIGLCLLAVIVSVIKLISLILGK